MIKTLEQASLNVHDKVTPEERCNIIASPIPSAIPIHIGLGGGNTLAQTEVSEV